MWTREPRGDDFYTFLLIPPLPVTCTRSSRVQCDTWFDWTNTGIIFPTVFTLYNVFLVFLLVLFVYMLLSRYFDDWRQGFSPLDSRDNRVMSGKKVLCRHDPESSRFMDFSWPWSPRVSLFFLCSHIIILFDDLEILFYYHIIIRRIFFFFFCFSPKHMCYQIIYMYKRST